jgi:hypothetical protein
LVTQKSNYKEERNHMIVGSLKIDEEFHGLISPLTTEEFSQLKENILKDGCRDALIVWNGTIVDGHNRYKICTENNIPFRTDEKEFSDRLEVKKWMLENQLGRRNLNDFCKAEIVLRNKDLITEIAEKAKERQRLSEGRGQKGMTNCSDLNAEKGTVRKVMADITHTSEGNIQRSKLIVEEGTEEQVNRARVGGRGNSVHSVYNEIKNKNLTEKTCSKCKKTFPVSDFQKDGSGYTSQCKECRSQSRSASRTTDTFGRPILISDELRNVTDEQIIGTLYDTDADIIYTIEDLAEEMQSNYFSFERIFKNCLNMHKGTIESAENKAIISKIFETININLRKMEEEYL